MCTSDNVEGHCQISGYIYFIVRRMSMKWDYWVLGLLNVGTPNL